MPNPKTIMIDDTEYVRKGSVPPIQLPHWEVGQEYYIETVTKYFLGQLVSVTDKELVIVKASWVADTGRFNEFLAGKTPKENEPYGESDLVILGRGALISSVKRGIVIEVV